VSADADAARDFEALPDDELKRYAQDWGVEDRESLSRDDLVKALRSRQGTTGTAPESGLPVERRGPSQPGHTRGEAPA
jgi:hypothetical protein